VFTIRNYIMVKAGTMTARTKTDEELERAEAAHADDPERAELIARVRRFKATWFELGEALTEIKRSGRYRRWGFQSFEDYCKRELHLRQDTADKLTGSFTFLKNKAPQVLGRDGRDAPIPTYQAVDFWRRAEESEAPAETVDEIRRHVVEEGTPLPKLSRLYREVVFPLDEDTAREGRKKTLRATIDRMIELLALGKDDGAVPAHLAAEIEEPLQRLAQHLKPPRAARGEHKVEAA
jgi:hypothetical protein